MLARAALDSPSASPRTHIVRAVMAIAAAALVLVTAVAPHVHDGVLGRRPA